MVTKLRPRHPGSRPTVSVVVPCYNYGHFLPECVHSVLDQEGVEVDVLIVDDASPDGSVRVARQLAAEDPRVKVLAHEVNKGHIATYNEGLGAVDGEYVVLLSADDLLTPGSLARSTALLQARPDVGLVYGFSPGISEPPQAPRMKAHSWSIWPGDEWIASICKTGANPVGTPEVVMRTSLMRELVGYDSRVPHAADLLLWLRAAARTAIGRVNGTDQAFYRKHGSNMHVERYSGIIVDIVERRRSFEILFAEPDTAIANAEVLHRQARRALAREALLAVCESYLPGAGGQDQRDQLLGLAEQMYPRSADEAFWRVYEDRIARFKHGPSRVSRWAGDVTDDVVRRIRWRRWRRHGLMGAVKSI